MKKTAKYAVAKITEMNKGLGYLQEALEPEDIASLGWNLLHEDLSLPSAVLYEDRLMHNLDWMQQFITAHGVKLAPHGKTTMAPKLFQMQLQKGAWGITLATAHQSLVAYQHGVRRILMANQLIGKENMAIISRLLRDPALEYFCLVDSAPQVDQLGEFYSVRGQRLNVLLELGVTGGRSGVRDQEQLESLLAALSRWRNSLVLSGVEIYEGVLDDEASIRAFLHWAVVVTRKLAEEKQFQNTSIILSGAGSAWYDVVADVFSTARFEDTIEIVLRPGCYITHDVGAYRDAQSKILQRDSVAHRMHPGLLPALHVWAYVQGMPEARKAIIGMGKRDVAFDAGLPSPALHFRPGDTEPKTSPSHWTLTKMMDQHAYLHIGMQDDLQVGDMIAFDISHPCLTFDKWRTVPVLNAQYQVIDVIQTFF
ncbi:MAG: amino acid deaminase [Alloacidobacterium sp.]|jgi:D-serine dehydratase